MSRPTATRKPQPSDAHQVPVRRPAVTHQLPTSYQLVTHQTTTSHLLVAHQLHPVTPKRPKTFPLETIRYFSDCIRHHPSVAHQPPTSPKYEEEAVDDEALALDPDSDEETVANDEGREDDEGDKF
jgi:hypothetical protein